MVHLNKFLHLNISFSLSNEYADLKKNLWVHLFKKLKNHDFSCVITGHFDTSLWS